ncbi:glycosyltransferase family 4 protein [Escherichia coli]|uniref:glycosyltransferase family 4 protein n=1 Tax=Escherichia coli TaxID=562 RepID=UPI00069B4892|nr:glycosyltransferase family 4 protein [Escherichia coli]ELJ1033499.1 glycosyltransferase family 4 protein [Escherichia coli O2]MCF0158373.1 glycosyltransferase family 4 protein [Veillonella sp.]EFB9802357.1 glycosyltransferase family 4 protein [Escherichia coli]EFD5105325.1 glycosyltransferase family 4 protein [Escherichia coli]EFN2003997.1 glycosyltransferase family 4 protein [Escherichia coli]
MSSLIAIYHPSYHQGGTEVLFSRLVDVLIKSGNSIAVIDYENGILNTNLKKEGVTYYNVNSNEWYLLLDTYTFLISARNIMRFLFICKDHEIKDPKVMFWQLHPSELYSGHFPYTARIKSLLGYHFLRYFLKLIPGVTPFRKTIEQLTRNNNLKIMDEACLRESSWVLDCEIMENYLPLLTGLKQRNTVRYYSNSDKNTVDADFNVAIISRLDEFKTAGVIKSITDILAYDSRILIHVVGDGKDRGLIQEKFKNVSNVFFHGFIINSELDDFFISYNIRLLFAMGTSALEGVSRGVPTVLLPCADKPLKDNYVYKFIHDQCGYSLGEYLQTPFCSKGYYSMVDVFNKYFENINKIHIDTLLFFNTYYAEENVNIKIINSISNVPVFNLRHEYVNSTSRFLVNFMNSIKNKSGI